MDIGKNKIDQLIIKSIYEATNFKEELYYIDIKYKKLKKFSNGYKFLNDCLLVINIPTFNILKNKLSKDKKEIEIKCRYTIFIQDILNSLLKNFGIEIINVIDNSVSVLINHNNNMNILGVINYIEFINQKTNYIIFGFNNNKIVKKTMPFKLSNIENLFKKLFKNELMIEGIFNAKI